MLAEVLKGPLMEAPQRLNRFVDACMCGRADKAAVIAIKKQLEDKDHAIEELEKEIRRKDSEKDNLMHMQKELQAQIEEIRLLLESHAAEAQTRLSDEQAAAMMQRRTRGVLGRKKVQRIKEERQQSTSEERAAQAMQARVRGNIGRKQVSAKQLEASAPSMQADGGPAVTLIDDETDPGYDDLDEAGASSMFDEDDGSVDSDYDIDDGEFTSLGDVLLEGKLKMAKVYGQEDPPAAEHELQWETRHFVLHSKTMCHYDDMDGGLPVGEKGMVDLSKIKRIEKVKAPGNTTFVMKGEQKVYLLKVEPHDEVMMRTWIGAISQELAPSPR